MLYTRSRAVFIGFASLIFLFQTLSVYESDLLHNDESEGLSLLYESEGLLGQLRVLDEYYPELNLTDRSMLVNGIPQTFVNAENGFSYWYYVHMLSTICSSKPAGSDVLLLGFGGGSVANELTRLDLKVDAVEIDKRMYQIAQDYFKFNPKNTILLLMTLVII